MQPTLLSRLPLAACIFPGVFSLASIVFGQAAQASLARLRGRVAGADDPQVAWHQQQSSDLSRVALMGGGGSSSMGMAGTGVGPEVRKNAGAWQCSFRGELISTRLLCSFFCVGVPLQIEAGARFLFCKRFLSPAVSFYHRHYLKKNYKTPPVYVFC